jgi:hypothetical protein
MPTSAKHSLMVQGTPCSGGSDAASSLARRRSASSASARASSKRVATTALSVGFTRSTSAMQASTISRELTARRRMRAATSTALALRSSSRGLAWSRRGARSVIVSFRSGGEGKV